MTRIEPKRVISGVKISPIKVRTKSLVKRVAKELTRFNETKAGKHIWKPLGIEVRSSEGKIVAGLVGGSFWGCLSLEGLWVDKKFRGGGLGRQLMAVAEAEGRRRGCYSVILNTISFQAPGFYRKLGYKPFGRLKDHPKGYSVHWFLKKL